MKNNLSISPKASAYEFINYLKNQISGQDISPNWGFLAKALLMRCLGIFIANFLNHSAYYDVITELSGPWLHSFIVELGQLKLVKYLRERALKAQPNHIRWKVSIVSDKTDDGPRYGKKQKGAVRQHSGTHGQIKTHGWYYIIAVLGTDNNAERVCLGSKMYEKRAGEAEWQVGLDLLESVGAVLDKAGLSRDEVIFVADAKYSCDDALLQLMNNGWIFVLKAGGRKKAVLGDILDSLANHAKRNWKGKYKTLSPSFLASTDIVKYKRFVSKELGLVYFQGLFAKPYEKHRHPRRFVVTNRKDATPQWAFSSYAQRWSVECYFRVLKQTCGWTEYHPQTSGDRYLTHTALTLLSYLFLDHIMRHTKGWKKLTHGQTQRGLVKKWLKRPNATEFKQLLEEILAGKGKTEGD